MKLTVLLLTATCLQLKAESYAQQITLKGKDIPVEKIFESIYRQSGYQVVYSYDVIQHARNVTVKLKDMPLEKVLQACFEDQPFTYTIIDKTIVLKQKKTPSPATVQAVFPQPITGRVTDAVTGEPLAGVTIQVKGTTAGTNTDDAGRFSLTVPEDAVLVVTYIGYVPQEVHISGTEGINIKLKPKISSLDQLVVIGYGTMKKGDLTGAITSVSGDKLTSTPIISADQGLQGRAAGVQVLQSSGQPGSSPRIRIRGTNSINGGSMPLYVIDGFPIYPGEDAPAAGLSSNAGLDPLSTIDPNNIESVEVLKDASATAIYGSRASNGVVIITTKRGEIGRSLITYNAYYGIQSLANKIKLLNGYQYALAQNEAYARRGLALRYNQATIDSLKKVGGTDWQDALYQDAPMQSHNVTLNGGNKATKYSLSAGYLTQKGIIINSGFKRLSFSINLDQQINDKLSVGTTLSYNNARSDLALTNTTGSANGGVSFRALNEDPTKPIYTEEGGYNYDKASLFWAGNPIADAMLTTNKAISDRLMGNIFTQWKIIPGLTAKAVFGIDMENREDRHFTPAELPRDNGLDAASLAMRKDFTWLNDYTINYHKIFNRDNDFNIVIGSSFQAHDFHELDGSTRGLVIEGLEYYSLSGGTVPAPPVSSFTDWAFASFFGRLNYGYKNKYLFTLTSRYDGSSRFGENRKWGFFPSAAIAWKLGEEDFIKNTGIFSDLKLRSSYGLTGNSEIGLYKTQQTLSQTYYTFGDDVVIGYGPNPTNLANPSLGWEATSQLNIGLDLSVLKDRISANIDWYRKVTTNLLFNITVPPSSGRSSSQKNLGRIENKGIEFNLNTINISSRNFQWSTSFNVSHNRNRVKDLGGPDLIISGATALKIGQPLGSFYGYLFDGIIQTGEVESAPKIDGTSPQPGYLKYKDIDGDNKITPNDRTIMGNPDPDFFGGITNTLSYKGFEFNIFLTGSKGYDIYSRTKYDLLSGRGERNSLVDILKAWSENHPSNDIPINGIKDTPSYQFMGNPNSWLIEHVSYLRIQDITLTYYLPKGILQKLKLSSLKVYVSANNIYTFTNYRYGYDPEANSSGNDNLSANTDYDIYPRSKSVTVGINVTF